MTQLKDSLQEAVGRRIEAAASSLTKFTVTLDSGVGLLIEAAGTGESPKAAAKIVEASALPKEKEAVCAVNWGWIYGSTIAKVEITPNQFKFQLDPAGPVTVSVQVWKGSPFLAFQPFRPA